MPLHRMYTYPCPYPIRSNTLWLATHTLVLLVNTISKIILKSLKNFAKYPEILPKVLRNNLKIFKEKSKNFENYCGEFRGIFPKILRIILKNIENHFKKFLEKFQKNSRKLWKFSRSISENFIKFRELFPKILRIKLFWKISKIISESFENFRVESRNITKIFEKLI